MWRWLNSLPRAVRSHFHGPGASAGISVEDKYEAGCSQVRCEARQREKTWRPHCKQRAKKKAEQEKGKRAEEPKSEKINLNPNFGHHSPIEAFGWGGALAIGIQLSQLHSLHEKYGKRDRQRSGSCPLYRVVHALPGIVSPVTHTQLKKHVLQTDEKQHEDIDLRKEDIFEFTLHRIEQELLQEFAKTEKSETIHCNRERNSFSSKKPEWAKIVYPSGNDESSKCFVRKISADISVIRNLSKELFNTKTDETCSNGSVSTSLEDCGCVDDKFNILDLAQQVKRRQSLSDTIHWLPTGFELPQPTFGQDILGRYGVSRIREEKVKESSHTDKAKKSQQTKVESLEDVFDDFKNICKDYTATGKSMMGVQEAVKGNMKGAIELWEESSMLGNSKALYNLGLCFETGKGVKQNISEAVKYYTLAAEADHPLALYNLSLVYMEGSHGFPRDQKHGLKLLHQAADQGLVEEDNRTGGLLVCWSYGYTLGPAEFEELWKPLFQALRYLGVFYANEEADWKTAVHYFKQAVKQKDMESQYYLGMCYEEGSGVEENTCKAAQYYKQASDQGHDDAQYRLAQFHLNGLGGLPVNATNGMELLKAAAEQGHSEARVNLLRLRKELHLQSGAELDSHHSITQLTKIPTSVSSPTLTDFVCNSFSSNRGLSSSGSLSQLFYDLVLPGYHGNSQVAASEEKITDYTEKSSSDVIFTLGCADSEQETPYIQRERPDNEKDDSDYDDDDCEFSTGNIFRNPLGKRRNYTMPDLHIVSCF